MKPYRAWKAILLLSAMSAFGIFFVWGIVLVNDYPAAVFYAVVVLLIAVFAVLSANFYVVFQPDCIELRQGYLYAAPGKNKNRTKESWLSPISKTTVYYRDVRRVEIDRHQNTVIEKKNGDRIEISFWGYFAEKEILEKLRQISQNADV